MGGGCSAPKNSDLAPIAPIIRQPQSSDLEVTVAKEQCIVDDEGAGAQMTKSPSKLQIRAEGEKRLLGLLQESDNHGYLEEHYKELYDIGVRSLGKEFAKSLLKVFCTVEGVDGKCFKDVVCWKDTWNKDGDTRVHRIWHKLVHRSDQEKFEELLYKVYQEEIDDKFILDPRTAVLRGVNSKAVCAHVAGVLDFCSALPYLGPVVKSLSHMLRTLEDGCTEYDILVEECFQFQMMLVKFNKDSGDHCSAPNNKLEDAIDAARTYIQTNQKRGWFGKVWSNLQCVEEVRTLRCTMKRQFDIMANELMSNIKVDTAEILRWVTVLVGTDDSNHAALLVDLAELKHRTDEGHKATQAQATANQAQLTAYHAEVVIMFGGVQGSLAKLDKHPDETISTASEPATDPEPATSEPITSSDLATSSDPATDSEKDADKELEYAQREEEEAEQQRIDAEKAAAVSAEDYRLSRDESLQRQESASVAVAAVAAVEEEALRRHSYQNGFTSEANIQYKQIDEAAQRQSDLLADVGTMTKKELKEFIKSNGGSVFGLLEKSELVEAANVIAASANSLSNEDSPDNFERNKSLQRREAAGDAVAAANLREDERRRAAEAAAAAVDVAREHKEAAERRRVLAVAADENERRAKERQIKDRAKQLEMQLFVAATAGDIDSVRHLVDHGVNLESKHGTMQLTALHCAAMNMNGVEGEHDDVIQFLLDEGVDKNSLSHNNSTPLHDAAYFGRSRAVSILLKAGANVNPRNDKGQTPRHQAQMKFSREHNKIIDLLDRYESDAPRAVNNMFEGDSKEFYNSLGHRDGLVVIDFYAAWCGHCVSFEPSWERLAKRFPEVSFCRVICGHRDRRPEKRTWWEKNEMADRIGIAGYPTFWLVEDSTKLGVLSGGGGEAYHRLDAMVEDAMQNIQMRRTTPQRTAPVTRGHRNQHFGDDDDELPAIFETFRRF
eukprot:CAMPEP_0181359998 /NCGR_PEP_ID=MMETSP1106-20121128/6413_1 /TAXON_ID=81844 /ORGANISM="Mantoniella antarctica, Strain SL-175" /LENGTH=950 /DNA_ID=CAMNT_0023473205 /DNA_START=213 /DNA_END=3066 /DNA_ORIENTATION=+